MAAADTVDHAETGFSLRAFLQGLAAVALPCILLAAFLVFKHESGMARLEKRLASQTVIVDWKTAPKSGHRGDEVYGPPKPEDAPPAEYRAPQYLESGLVDAPIDGLYEVTPSGHKPVIRKTDGLSPFMAYRRPFDVYAAGKPAISIVVTDLGLSDIATESAVRTMPPDVSFVMSPYTETLDFWVGESRARGHEIWLTMPVETKDYPLDDPGPHTMLIGAPERENMAKLDWLLTRVDGYIGFVTNFEPIFMKSANDMRPIIGAVYNSGLAFVDGSADPGLIPQTMAAGMKAPYSAVDVWIDMPDASQASIRQSLERLEEIAREQGFAVGVIRPLPVSYQQVLRWVETLDTKELVLAPLSATTGK